MSTRDEKAEATREQLLGVARELFAAHGYAGVGTELIVTRAGLTRGALYHHFRDKHDLFRAVYERLEQELVDGIAAKVSGVADPAVMLSSGLRAFLDACGDPVVSRIALVEAPTVLGWAAWREVGERFGLGLVVATLQNAMAAGAVRPQPARALAHVLMGALCEAAQVIANADDPDLARREIESALLNLLGGLAGPAPDRERESPRTRRGK